MATSIIFTKRDWGFPRREIAGSKKRAGSTLLLSMMMERLIYLKLSNGDHKLELRHLLGVVLMPFIIGYGLTVGVLLRDRKNSAFPKITISKNHLTILESLAN
jgi:hypothetical protein